MTCFTYKENDILGFDLDYTSTSVVLTIYLNGELVDTISFEASGDNLAFQPFAQFGSFDDTDASIEFRTYPTVQFFDVPDGAEPLENPEGFIATEYLSTGGYISKPSDTFPNRPYHDDIKSFPVFRRSVDSAFLGSTEQPFGDIVIHNEDGTKDNWLDRSWGGRDLVLFIGDRNWPRDDFRQLMRGTAHELSSPDESSLSFRLRDKGIFLEKFIQETRFLDGPSEGNLKPLCFGECYHVPAVLVDNNHTYMVHDGPIEDILEVFEAGTPVSFTADLNSGTFTLQANPERQVTAHVKGAKFSGIIDSSDENTYHDTVAQIAYHLLDKYSDVSNINIDGANLLAFDNEHQESVGLFINANKTFVQALDQLLVHLSGFWGFDRYGKFVLGRLRSPTNTLSSLSGTTISDIVTPISEITVPINELGPTSAIATGFTIKEDDVVQRGMSIIKRQLPLYKVNLGYKRYWRPLSVTEQAGVLESFPSVSADLEREFREVRNERPATLLHHALSSETDLIETVLVNKEDADFWALNRRELFAHPRTSYSIQTLAAPFGVEIGDVIDIEYYRYGFESGKKVLVTAYSESINPDRVDLEVWR
jgi:hypothetical protein